MTWMMNSINYLEIEDTSNTGSCAEKSPTAQEILVEATLEGSQGEAHEAGSCHKLSPIT